MSLSQKLVIRMKKWKPLNIYGLYWHRSSIYEEMKCRLKEENSCYYSVGFEN